MNDDRSHAAAKIEASESPPVVAAVPRGLARDKAALLCAVICLLFYLLTLAGHQFSIDGVIMFQNARNLVKHGSLTFDPPLQWGGAITHSQYGIGMTLAYLPSLAIWSPLLAAEPPLSQQPHDWRLFYGNASYFFASLTNPLIMALMVFLLFHFALELGGSRRVAAATALICGLASPAGVYARFDFAQPLVALGIVGTLLFAARYRRVPAIKGAFLAGVFAGVAILTRFDALQILPWAMLAMWGSRGQRNRRALAGVGMFLAPVLLAIIVTLVLNVVKFGEPFVFGYGPGASFQVSMLPYGIAGLLVSPGIGLLPFFPLAILGPLGALYLWRRDRLFTAVLAGIICSYVVTNGAWSQWWGGWSWGPRLLIPIVPLVVLLSVLGVGRLRVMAGAVATRALAVVLLALSLLASLSGILVDILKFNGWLFSHPGLPGLHGERFFALFASPAVSAWQFLKSPGDVDVAWLWAARGTHGLSLVPPAAFLLGLLLCARLLHGQLREPQRQASI